MENIKQSLENIKRHLVKKFDRQVTDNPTMYISDALDIIAMLKLAIDQNKVIVGLGFINYSSNKDYKDFPVSCMYDKGFLLSEGSEE
jgi:hypothetical protein